VETIYGMDLGTSYCLVAEAQVRELLNKIRIRTLVDNNGEEKFSSVVHFEDFDNVIVGDNARRKLPYFPEKTIELIKLRLGNTNKINIKVDNKSKQLSPQEISALTLKHFNKLHNDKIKKAILTVPAYFDDNEKNATLQAGKLAGIEIVELIEEPSAAIMYHLYDKYKENGLGFLKEHDRINYLIFDFGGGTLDLSVIKVELDTKGNVKPTVLAKGGDKSLGGNTIDKRFTKLIIEFLQMRNNDSFISKVAEEFKFYSENNSFRSSTKAEVKEFILNLKMMAEEAKINLSKNQVETIIPGRTNKYKSFEIHRKDFEEEVLEKGNIGKRVIEALNSLLDSIDDLEVHQFILVGGTSQIPYFRENILKEFPKLKGRIKSSINYTNAIAKGAAILGAIKSGKNIVPFGSNRCHNNIAHDIYIEHDDDNKNLFIKKGLRFSEATKKASSFKIKHSLDTKIKIKLKEEYEYYNPVSNKRDKKEKIIKEFDFYHPFFYTGEEIEIRLKENDKGTLSFLASHSSTGEEISFDSKKLFQLKDNEIKEAQKNIKKINIS
jgi:molecular chaperone DnaK